MKDYIAEFSKKNIELERIKAEINENETKRAKLEESYKEQIRPIEEEYRKQAKPLAEEHKMALEKRTDTCNGVYGVLSKIHEHSFFGEDIWEYIVLLISLFEGKEYHYFVSHPDFVEVGYYEKQLFENMEAEFVKKLSFEDSAFYLYFVKEKHGKYELNPTIDFVEYDYVLQYLNALINYRINNNIGVHDSINRYALEEMKKFIDENRELLKMRRALRVAEEEQKMDNYFAKLLENLEDTTGRKA